MQGIVAAIHLHHHMAKSGDQSDKFNASMRIIVLYGPERFLVEEHTRRIAEMLDERFGGVEQFNFDGGTASPAAVLDELRSYGLMQKHKLVVLDNADQFLAGGRGASEDDEGEEGDGDSGGAGEERTTRRPLMERYAENPVDDATLVMRAATWRKGNLDKLILKCGTIEECKEQPADAAARWCIKRCAKRYDATLEPDAASLMVARLGPSLQRLDTELLKLASMAGKNKVITRQLIDENIAPSLQEKAWEIQSAVASGDAAEMLGKLHDLMDVSRQEWVPISWAITDLMRKEHAASHLMQRGVSGQAIARQLRLWGDSIGAVLDAARRGEPLQFAQLLRESIQADHHSKSGVGEPERNLETLLVRISEAAAT